MADETLPAAKHRLHIVKWRDAHGIKREDTVEDTLKEHRPAIYWSAGILVRSDAVGVTTAQDLGIPQGPDEQLSYRSRTFIPRELVVEEFDAGLVIRNPKRTHGTKSRRTATASPDPSDLTAHGPEGTQDVSSGNGGAGLLP